MIFANEVSLKGSMDLAWALMDRARATLSSALSGSWVSAA